MHCARCHAARVRHSVTPARFHLLSITIAVIGSISTIADGCQSAHVAVGTQLLYEFLACCTAAGSPGRCSTASRCCMQLQTAYTATALCVCYPAPTASMLLNIRLLLCHCPSRTESTLKPARSAACAVRLPCTAHTALHSWRKLKLMALVHLRLSTALAHGKIGSKPLHRTELLLADLA